MELITFMSKGRLLVGTLEAPSGPVVGAVAIVHGWGGCRIGPHRLLVAASRAMRERSMAVLRFDLGGRGDSEGDPLESDLDSMIDDTRAALDLLSERFPGVPLALLGMCSGGNVSLAAAAMHGGVDAVVAWSTYPFQEQRTGKQDSHRRMHMLRSYVRKALKVETWRKLLAGRVNFRMVKRAIHGEPSAGEARRNLHESRRDLLKPLGRYRGRILFVFGGSDPEAVDAHRVFREFAARNGLSMEFQEIEGANHNFYSLQWKQLVVDRSAEWLSGQLA